MDNLCAVANFVDSAKDDTVTNEVKAIANGVTLP
jgi:hypothetical protein